jgi:hypothetical protein
LAYLGRVQVLTPDQSEAGHEGHHADADEHPEIVMKNAARTTASAIQRRGSDGAGLLPSVCGILGERQTPKSTFPREPLKL